MVIFFTQYETQNYEKGRELMQEKYLEGFDEYKGSLLSSKETANVPVATLVMFLMVSSLIGSYELTALLIGFIIGKLIRR